MFLQGGSQCFSSLSQKPSMKGLRHSWPGPGVGGALGTAAAQVKTHWHGSRKAHCPAFMARMDNFPLQIRATPLPKEQLAPSCSKKASLT